MSPDDYKFWRGIINLMFDAGVYLTLFFALMLFVDEFRFWYIGIAVSYWIIAIFLRYKFPHKQRCKPAE